MDNFEFKSVGRILFGRGQFARIGELASRFGRTALVIANGGDTGDGGNSDTGGSSPAPAGCAAGVVGADGIEPPTPWV